MQTDPRPRPPALRIEVAYATPLRQALVAVALPPGATVAQAVRKSGIAKQFPDCDLANAPLGIWGERADGRRRLRDGDRVEIYRPLLIDPREARRRLAAHGGTMGRGGLPDDAGD